MSGDVTRLLICRMVSAMPQDGSELQGPTFFANVEPGVYRSSTPLPSNYALIQRIKLKTFLHLSSESLETELSDFLNVNEVRVIELGSEDTVVPEVQSHFKPCVTEDIVKMALEIIIDIDNYPILIASSSGLEQVSTVVGCLRRLQGWQMSNIYDEMYRFSRLPHKTWKVNQADLSFVESFDVSIVTFHSAAKTPLWVKQYINWNKTKSKSIITIEEPLLTPLSKSDENELFASTKEYMKQYSAK